MNRYRTLQSFSSGGQYRQNAKARRHETCGAAEVERQTRRRVAAERAAATLRTELGGDLRLPCRVVEYSPGNNICQHGGLRGSQSEPKLNSMVRNTCGSNEPRDLCLLAVFLCRCLIQVRSPEGDTGCDGGTGVGRPDRVIFLEV